VQSSGAALDIEIVFQRHIELVLNQVGDVEQQRHFEAEDRTTNPPGIYPFGCGSFTTTSFIEILTTYNFKTAGNSNISGTYFTADRKK